MRNIEAQKTQGKEVIRKHPRADITYNEFNALYEKFQSEKKTSGEGNALFYLIEDAFMFGVAVGSRNAK